ncbi:class I SAM-dependent methyltransferase [Herbiconiux ginsengi]|uniref:Methyltransferase domain-containing protein n=1 Tax=Herbiconiux ginsengi TaxID=381665 RepID=A0A1H3S536_9MICO|nr:class I SAM-dependent methyltransferase [Herbiconiux ginsengi]SDZ32994.1 Methyltransferase domain-containing protein [Herbiconiux ginsengi]
MNDVGLAYSRRAAEYIELFGEIGAAHPSDRHLIATWADTLEGPVIDAGCGPGHWTDHLAERGLDARGVDQVPEFIARARSTYPGVPFTLGSLNTLDAESGSIGGVLSWYSLIHHEPSTIGMPLREFRRVLRPGGEVLIGFLEGPVVEGYAHAVTPAYLWSVDALGEELQSAGFEVTESHVRKTAGQRSQAAIIARTAQDTHEAPQER